MTEKGGNLKLQLQLLQEKQKNFQKDDQQNSSIMNTNNYNSTQKEGRTKNQSTFINNKENIISYQQIQASTLESNQLFQKKTTQNDHTTHSDIFNTSNNIKTQGMLGLKFSNTYTQPLQAQGEVQTTVTDNCTLESIENLNSIRSKGNTNSNNLQQLGSNTDNIILNLQYYTQNEGGMINGQQRRYSLSNNSNNNISKQPETTLKASSTQKRVYNKHNIPQKIESSEERIISACHLNFDDRQSSFYNEDSDPSSYCYNENNQVKLNRGINRNKSQDSVPVQYTNPNANDHMQPMNQKYNFQKKPNNNNELIEDGEIKLKAAIEKQKQQFLLQKQLYEEQMNVQYNTDSKHQAQNQYQYQMYGNQEGQKIFNSTVCNEDEGNEGERQKVKYTKDVSIKEQGNNHCLIEQKAHEFSLNFNSDTEERKVFLENNNNNNIFTTNSDLPSTIPQRFLKSETSNVQDRGNSLNDYQISKIQMSFIHEVDEEQSSRQRSTLGKLAQNGNDSFNNTNIQHFSSQRVVTLNPNQDVPEEYIPIKNIINANCEDQKLFYQQPQQNSYYQNNVYNTPTLKEGKLSENTYESMDFQQNKQNTNFISNFNVPQQPQQENQKQINGNQFITYPSMFDKNTKMYHESEASICNEMQEINCNKNDKPKLKSLNLPNKVTNPAELSSHATEENNSFQNSYRNCLTAKQDSERQLIDQTTYNAGQNDNFKRLQNDQNKLNPKQEQFLQQYESKRPHFLSQEIQIPIVSDNYNNNYSQNQQQQQESGNGFENNYGKEQFDEEQFIENLNTLICDNSGRQQNYQIHQQYNQDPNIQKNRNSSHPPFRKDTEEQCSNSNSIKISNISNQNITNQSFVDYDQQRIQKTNDEIRKKLKQISYASGIPSSNVLNTTIQQSQTPTTQRDPEEKSFHFINNDINLTNQSYKKQNSIQLQSQFLNQSCNQSNVNQPPFSTALPNNSSQQNSQLFSNHNNAAISNVLPLSQQNTKINSSVIPVTCLTVQSQSPVNFNKSHTQQNQLSHQEKSFNSTCSNMQLYQDIHPSLKKSEAQMQEPALSSSRYLNQQVKQLQNQSTLSTISSGINKKSITNSRYEKFECKESQNQKSSSKQIQTQKYQTNDLNSFNESKSLIENNQQQYLPPKSSNQESSYKNSKPIPPQIDADLSSDDLQINPFDVISPQEKIANFINFQSGHQENPHQYPSFAQPPQSNSNLPLFVNQDTETCLQQITLQNQECEIQQPLPQSCHPQTIQIESLEYLQNQQVREQQQGQQLLNNIISPNNNNRKGNTINSNFVKQQILDTSKQQIPPPDYFSIASTPTSYQINFETLLPPQSSKNSSNNTPNSTQNNGYQQNVFSYKQFMMNMKKNLDQNLIKQTCKKPSSQNDSFARKAQVAKKPSIGNQALLQADKATPQSNNMNKLNKLIDKQIEKNVIRPIMNRKKSEQENTLDLSNTRRKSSISSTHHQNQYYVTPSTPGQNPHKSPISQRPTPSQINCYPLDLDTSLRHYIPEQFSKKSSSSSLNGSQSKNSIHRIPSKSQINTPKSTVTTQMNNSFLNNTNQSRINIGSMLNDISYTTMTPSTSKSNLNRNNSFVIPKERNQSFITKTANNSRENSQTQRNQMVSKSPLQKKNSSFSSNGKSNKNLMINTNNGRINERIDPCLDEGFSTQTNTTHSKRSESHNFVNKYSKR